MAKNNLSQCIKDLRKQYHLTQEDLAEELRKQGIEITQATVSRDIKELALIKVTYGEDQYRYSLPTEVTVSEARLRFMLKEFVLIKCWMPHSEDYYAYNGVSWYLSTYLFVCMLAPYVLKLVSKIKNQTQLFISGSVIYIVMFGAGYLLSLVQIPIGDGFAVWLTYICPLYRILDFSLGVMLGWMFLHRPEQKLMYIRQHLKQQRSNQ